MTEVAEIEKTELLDPPAFPVKRYSGADKPRR